MYTWVTFDNPTDCWPDNGLEQVRGDGDLVGDGHVAGDGDGVRASGERGICPIDLRRFGELRFLDFPWSLIFNPCKEDGRAEGDLK